MDPIVSIAQFPKTSTVEDADNGRTIRDNGPRPTRVCVCVCVGGGLLRFAVIHEVYRPTVGGVGRCWWQYGESLRDMGCWGSLGGPRCGAAGAAGALSWPPGSVRSSIRHYPPHLTCPLAPSSPLLFPPPPQTLSDIYRGHALCSRPLWRIIAISVTQSKIKSHLLAWFNVSAFVSILLLLEFSWNLFLWGYWICELK